MTLIGEKAWFELASLVQLSGGRRETLIVQLHRWCQAGKLIPLRRGMYAFPDRYARERIHAAEVAGFLYGPSYLSTHWALAWHGMIPEHVARYTSVTTRAPKDFENAFGLFEYRHVKASVFFGYRLAEIDGRKVLLAEPEKALLDLWHLERGAWDKGRMEEMRFQQFDLVNEQRLRMYAARFDSPRLTVAVDNFMAVARADTEGAVEL